VRGAEDFLNCTSKLYDAFTQTLIKMTQKSDIPARHPISIEECLKKYSRSYIGVYSGAGISTEALPAFTDGRKFFLSKDRMSFNMTGSSCLPLITACRLYLKAAAFLETKGCLPDTHRYLDKMGDSVRLNLSTNIDGFFKSEFYQNQENQNVVSIHGDNTGHVCQLCNYKQPLTTSWAEEILSVTKNLQCSICHTDDALIISQSPESNATMTVTCKNRCKADDAIDLKKFFDLIHHKSCSLSLSTRTRKSKKSGHFLNPSYVMYEDLHREFAKSLNDQVESKLLDLYKLATEIDVLYIIGSSLRKGVEIIRNLKKCNEKLDIIFVNNQAPLKEISELNIIDAYILSDAKDFLEKLYTVCKGDNGKLFDISFFTKLTAFQFVAAVAKDTASEFCSLDFSTRHFNEEKMEIDDSDNQINMPLNPIGMFSLCIVPL
jgi:NAD-dependent SIR2 family protein deacetylase